MSKQIKPWHNTERVERLYKQAGMSSSQIASIMCTSKTTILRVLRESGVKIRSTGPNGYDYVPLKHSNGYEQWKNSNHSVYVHQLLAISEGADPHQVFSDGEYQIHHENGVKWDNRPENVTLLTQEEHAKEHPERGSHQIYTEDELLEWIDVFVQYFGFVPRSNDLKGWPGPHPLTYRNRFGTFTKALKAAGHTPRSEQ